MARGFGLPPPALWYGVVEFAIPRRASLDGLRKQQMIGGAGRKGSHLGGKQTNLAQGVTS